MISTLDSASRASMAPSGTGSRHVVERIAVATAGASGCGGALRTASALSLRHDAHVSVLSVFHPRIPYPVQLDRAGHLVVPDSDRHPARQQLTDVRHQLAALGVSTERWSLSFAAGNVAVNVTTLANTDRADLVIIGLGRDDPTERGLGDRGSMAIAATIQIPLLAVASIFDAEPRHVMIAVGNDTSAVKAAQLVRELFPAPDQLSVVHVTERAEQAPIVRCRVDEVRQAVTGWAPSVDAWTLTGDPIDELLGFVHEHGVDLVVGGLHGHSFDERAITRNALLWIMGVGDCSVLLVPFTPARPVLAATPHQS